MVALLVVVFSCSSVAAKRDVGEKVALRSDDQSAQVEAQYQTANDEIRKDAEQQHASRTFVSNQMQKNFVEDAEQKASGRIAATGAWGTVAVSLVGAAFLVAFVLLAIFARPTGGDVNASVGLLMDNVGQILAGSGAMSFALMMPFMEQKLKPTNIPDIVFGRVVPGMVPTMLFGCGYYAWMAVRVSRQSPQGTKVCALPYGINTPAMFCFIFGIIMPSVSEFAKEGMDPNVAVVKAWELGVASNLLAGGMSIIFAAFGPLIVKLLPSAALMIALAGIAFTWLGLHQVMMCFSFATVGLGVMVLGMMLLLGLVRTGIVPPALVIITVGTVAGWCSGSAWEGGGTSEALKEAAKSMGTAYFPGIITLGALEAVPRVLEENIGVVLPIAFSCSVGTLLNVKSAENAGDTYPLREAMLFDGLTTTVSALFGSPFGTCIYVGHKEYKHMGGYMAYMLLNGLIFSLCAMLGAFEVVNAIVPPYAIAPINLFVGLMIASDSLSAAPTRHLPACLIGLFPAIAAFIVDSQYVPAHPHSDYWGLVSLSKGAMLLCALWTAIFCCFIDCKFWKAAAWCVAGAAFSAIGLLHQSDLDFTFEKFRSSSFPYPDDFTGTQPISFVLGYGFLAIFLATLGVFQVLKLGIVPQEYQEEEKQQQEHEDPEKEASRLSKRVSTNKFREVKAGVQAEEQAAAKAKAEEEAVAKAKAEEEATSKAKAEEEATPKTKAEEEAAAKAKAQEEAAAKAKAEA